MFFINNKHASSTLFLFIIQMAFKIKILVHVIFSNQMCNLQYSESR